MAATYKDNGGSVDGSNKVFTYDFPVLQTEDIKVALNGVTQATTKYTPSLSPANITFNSTDVDSTVQESTGAPKSGVTVRVYRETTVGTNTGNEDPKVVFAAGSSIRAGDLNSNTEQALFGIHEQQEKIIQTEDLADDAVTSAKLDTNIDVAGTLDVTGAATLDSTLSVASNATVGGTLGITGTTTAAAINASGAVNATGNLAINTNKFNVNATSGDTTIAGTLGVTGNASFTQVLANGAYIDNVYIGINGTNEIDTSSGNLTLDSAGGTVVVDDALSVNGTTSANAINAAGAVNVTGNLAINTDKFNVTAANGNTTIAGTLGVTGSSSFTNAITGLNGAVIDNIYIGINNDNEIDTSSGNLTLDSAGGTVVVDDDLSVTGTITGTLGTDVVTSAAIEDDAVTYAKMQHVSATSKVLGRISSGAGVVEELSAANIKTIYESNAETNAYIDSHNTLVGGINATASEINSLDGFTGDKDDLNIVTGMTKALSSSSFPTTSDTAYPTAKAVNDHIVDIVNDVGGFVPVAVKAHLPNTHPDPENGSGTIISIANATGLRISDGSGSGDYAGTAGHSVSATTYNAQLLNGTVATITGFPSSLQGTQLSTKGLLIQTTVQSDSDYASAPVFTYHRLTLDEGGVASAQSAIDDFNEKYRTDTSDPGSDNDEGDLFFNKTSNTMKVYDGAAWKEVTSAGDFKYLYLCPAGGSGAPTLDGSIATYDLREGSNAGTGANVTKAAQLIVSINGVVQKANTGTSAPSEGFALVDSNTIIFGANLASGDSVFIVQVGSAVALNHPAEDSVVAASIDDGAILNEAINSNANIEASKLDNPLQFPDGHKVSFGSDGTGDLEIYHDGNHSIITAGTTGDLQLTSTNDDVVITGADDVHIQVQGGENGIRVYGDGAVKLYYGNSEKLETTSTGIQVTDNDTNVVVKLETSSGTAGYLYGAGNTECGIQDAQGHNAVLVTKDAAVELYYNNVKSFETNDNGATIYGGEGQHASLYLYADEGDDNADKLRLQQSSTGDFWIENYASGSWEAYLKAINNGAVELYHGMNGSAAEKKFETTSSGSTVFGSLYCSDHINLTNDGKYIAFGDSSELTIRHTSTNSLIKHEGTGDLYIDAYDKDIYIRSGDGNTSVENAISCIDNAQVELYHSGTKKFETGANGIDVQGRGSFYYDASIVAGLYLRNSNDSGTAVHFVKNDGAVVGSITQTASATAFNTSSDYRLKENEVAISDGITRLKTLKPYRFNFKTDTSTTVDGFFAHEVTAVPEAITGEKDETEMQQLDHSKLVPLLTAALQEAITKIETLETKVAALEAK